MDIARLRARIMIEKATVKVDRIGNRTNGWEEYYSCCAYPDTYLVDESPGKVDYENETIAFTVRACQKTKELNSTQYRVRFQDQVFNIASIDRMNYNNREIKIRCKKEVRQ